MASTGKNLKGVLPEAKLKICIIYREGTSIVASFPNKKSVIWTTILIRASPQFISHVEATGPFLSHIGKISSV